MAYNKEQANLLSNVMALNTTLHSLIISKIEICIQAAQAITQATAFAD